MNYRINKKVTIIFLVAVSFVVMGVFVAHYFEGKFNQKTTVVRPAKKVNPFLNLSLKAKSVFVWDVKKQKSLYALNEEAQLPLASLTKLMTALVSSEMAPRNTLVTINNADIQKEGDSGFFVGEKWTLSNLLDFTLMTSSNDGAGALASVIGFGNSKKGENLFIDAMNKKARQIGLVQTFFLDESGLDLNKNISGAYGSAKDVAMLMEYIIKNNPKILEATKYSHLKIKSKDFVHFAKNTNINVEAIPGVIASKTGFTDLAGGNLVVAFNLGIDHPIIVSVLGSTVEDRFVDVKKLVRATILFSD